MKSLTGKMQTSVMFLLILLLEHSTAKPIRHHNLEIFDVPVKWQWQLVAQIPSAVNDLLKKAGISNDEILGSAYSPVFKVTNPTVDIKEKRRYDFIDPARERSKISDFLLCIDLHPADVLLRSDQGLTKTIIDYDGRILTVNFRLRVGNGSRLNETLLLPTLTKNINEVKFITVTVPVNWQCKLVPKFTVPTMRGQLEKAGISRDEILKSYNGPIFKTNRSPTGRVEWKIYDFFDSTLDDSKISDFLLRMDLHPDDVLLRSDQGFTKTINNDDGSFLTAKFRLSGGNVHY